VALSDIYIDSETSSFSAAITLEPKDLRSHAAILHAILVLTIFNSPRMVAKTYTTEIN